MIVFFIFLRVNKQREISIEYLQTQQFLKRRVRKGKVCLSPLVLKT